MGGLITLDIRMGTSLTNLHQSVLSPNGGLGTPFRYLGRDPCPERERLEG